MDVWSLAHAEHEPNRMVLSTRKGRTHEPILPTITAPSELHKLSDAELGQLAQEIRDELVGS